VKGFLPFKVPSMLGNRIVHGRLLLDPSSEGISESNRVAEYFQKGKMLLFRQVKFTSRCEHRRSWFLLWCLPKVIRLFNNMRSLKIGKVTSCDLWWKQSTPSSFFPFWSQSINHAL